MAKPRQDLNPYLGIRNCGGLRRMPERGTGVISGTTKIGAGAGAAAPCRVTLRWSDGTLAGSRRTGVTGAYSFIGLPKGDYHITIADDGNDAWRPKVEVVRVT